MRIWARVLNSKESRGINRIRLLIEAFEMDGTAVLVNSRDNKGDIEGYTFVNAVMEITHDKEHTLATLAPNSQICARVEGEILGTPQKNRETVKGNTKRLALYVCAWGKQVELIEDKLPYTIKSVNALDAVVYLSSMENVTATV